ncbi:MAG: SDR family oxidoreductase [Burkholderiaceae bacterium]|nr:SDR family oxidoreductase [Burkholderiaceae bacterium]
MHDTTCLHGKVALITGAAGGLGSHLAQTLGRTGAKVVLAGRRKAPLEQLAIKLKNQTIDAHAVVMDVTDAPSVQAGFDQIQELYGNVNIAVCNAGVTYTQDSLTLPVQAWQQVIDVNLTGCWIVGNETARRLIQAGQPGSIINISSILGHRVAGNVLPYAVSKAGLEQMTRGLALEWARYGIRVNCLAPGYIETDLNREFFASDQGKALIKRIPQRRLGQAADLDGPLLLLASDASLYMTGSSIVVDGGHLQSTL